MCWRRWRLKDIARGEINLCFVVRYLSGLWQTVVWRAVRGGYWYLTPPSTVPCVNVLFRNWFCLNRFLSHSRTMDLATQAATTAGGNIAQATAATLETLMVKSVFVVCSVSFYWFDDMAGLLVIKSHLHHTITLS